MTLVITSGAQLMSYAGQDLGTSSWQVVDQESVNVFADLTADHNWIHVDVPKAQKMLGGTIVHGYFTLALGPKMWKEVVDFQGFQRGLNYGLNTVRFPAPMPVGGRLRSRVSLAEVTDLGDGAFQFTLRITMEAEGVAKPVCVSEAVLRLMEEPADG